MDDQNPESLRQHVGRMDQLASATPSVLDDGPGRGSRTVEVRMAGGLTASVLVDRALDLGAVHVGGVPLAWIGPPGPVHPAYASDSTWLRSFGGGLLTTAGLANVGPAGSYGDESYGLHGRISNTPAFGVRSETVVRGGHTEVRVAGCVRETSVYGPELTLEREYKFHLGKPVLEVHDVVTNTGWTPAPFMILYHFNLGFPLISPSAEIALPNRRRTKVSTSADGSGVQRWDRIEPPTPGATGEVFSHELDGEHRWISVINRATPFGPVGMRLEWLGSQLPFFQQWKMMAKGLYLTAVEPANNPGLGIDAATRDATLRLMEPGESANFDLAIRASTDLDEIDRLVL